MHICMANLSPLPQTRWVDIPVPFQLHQSLPETFMLGADYSVKGRAIGRRTGIIHSRVTMDGNEFRNGMVAPVVAVPRGYVIHPSILAALQGLTLRVEIGAETLLLPLGGLRPLEGHSDPACMEMVFRATNFGWHCLFVVKVYAGQSVVDYEMNLTWSDPLTPDTVRQAVSARIKVVGADMTINYDGERGWSYVDGGASVHVDRWLDGLTLRLTGSLLFGDTPAARIGGIAVTSENLADPGLYPRDLGLLVESVTDMESRARHAGDLQAQDRMANSWHPTGPRYLANGPQTGFTGAQWPFGAVKDLIAMQDPRRAYLLQHFMADDYCMRGHHHRTASGLRVMAADHPRWETFNAETERNSHDYLGKGRDRPYYWNYAQQTPNGRCSVVDDEHRGDLGILFAYAISGSLTLRDAILDLLESDLARAIVRRNQVDIEAPRASGRMWQSWAMMAGLFSDEPEVLAKIKKCSVDELEMRERQDADSLARGVIPWMWKVTSNNYNGALSMAIPWHEALAMLGVYQQAMAWEVLDPDLSERFITYGIRHCSKLMRLCIVDGGREGFFPVNAIRSDATEAEISNGMLAYPRPTTGWDAGPFDVILGSNDWWLWWSGVYCFVRDYLPAMGESLRLPMIEAAVRTLPYSEMRAGWWAPCQGGLQ
jgi:hypothetical protein